MLSVEDICNKALNFLEVSPISSIDEGSAEAIRCKSVYDSVRDSVLQDHWWQFATYFESLTAIASETVAGWTYLWVYPVKCITIRKVFLDDGSTNPDAMEYMQCLSPQTFKNAIATNENNPEICYTYQVTDPKHYDPKFVECLALRLAAEIGPAITGNSSKATEAMNRYSLAISEAKRLNAGNKNIVKTEDPSYLTARS